MIETLAVQEDEHVLAELTRLPGPTHPAAVDVARFVEFEDERFVRRASDRAVHLLHQLTDLRAISFPEGAMRGVFIEDMPDRRP